MNVPLKIAEIGGETLKEYIKTQINLDDSRARLVEVESRIKLDMIAIHDMIGDYLPEPESDRYYYGRFDTLDYRARAIIPNIKSRSNKVVLDIISAEEILKNIKPLILEMKGLEHDISRLKRLQETRER